MPCFNLPRAAAGCCGTAVLATLLLSGPAQAQAASATPPEAAPRASFRLSFRSALTEHTRHNEQAVGPWRELNDTVQRVGGWRAYAREASTDAAPPAPRGTTSGATP